MTDATSIAKSARSQSRASAAAAEAGKAKRPIRKGSRSLDLTTSSGVAGLLAKARKKMKKAASSPETALEALRQAGIVDDNGDLYPRYR